MNKTKNIVLCAMFVALTAVGAFIRIPTPTVPFTLQYLFTMLAGLILGGKLGCLSVCIYIALGLAGFPVFTQGSGPAYLFQPSFGYLVGFAVGALVTGIIANRVPRPGYGRLLAADFAGLGIVYLFGTVHYGLISRLYLDNPIGLWPLLLSCIFMTLPWDILKCVAAAALGKKLIPVLRPGKITG